MKMSPKIEAAVSSATLVLHITLWPVTHALHVRATTWALRLVDAELNEGFQNMAAFMLGMLVLIYLVLWMFQSLVCLGEAQEEALRTPRGPAPERRQ
jgi:hypothetical protein